MVYNQTMPKKDPEARAAYSRAYYARNREHLIAKADAWNKAHPEERRANSRAWFHSPAGQAYRASHREEYNAYQRAYDAAHPEKTALDNRVQRLRRFGLTIADYEAMLATQNGLCAVCGRAETSRANNGEVMLLAVDHDHVTGSVRALLCRSCNTGIGLLGDDPALLEVAAGYIRSFRR